MTFSLDNPFPVTDDMRSRFQRDGFIKIKNVLSAEEIARIEPVISGLVADFQKTYPPLEKDGYYHKQFVQLNGTNKISQAAKAVVFSKRFARLAADLMGVPSVRLYHDQALYKLPGGSHTLHHQDLSYWPLDTENACALWIPFQAVPLDMGPLAFYRGSHKFPYKSLDVITPEGEAKMLAYLGASGCEASHEPFDLGELSFHYGWTCHTAKPNTSNQVRKVFTINYFESGTRLSPKPTENQMGDRKAFPNTREGEIIQEAANPVLWP